MKKIFLMCCLVLTIVLLSVSSVFATEYEFVENVNLNNLSTWESGIYKPKNGMAVRFSPGIKINKKLKFLSKKYNVEIKDNEYCILITEFDGNSGFIKSTELKSGDVFTVSDSTSVFTLSMYSINKKGTFKVYQKLAKSGKFGLNLIPVDVVEEKKISEENVIEKDDKIITEKPVVESQPVIEEKPIVESKPTPEGNKVENDNVVDENKKNTIGAKEFVDKMKVGWNLGNTLEPYYGVPNGDSRMFLETYWKNPKVTKELFEYVKSVGFDTVRIPVTWDVHSEMSADGAIVIKTEWMERVREVVQYALDSGLNVILNTHHEKTIYAGTNEAEFKIIKNRAKTMWKQIADYFADFDERLIFESYNEIDNAYDTWKYGDIAAEQLNELNQLFVDVVRTTNGNNGHRILMVPTLLDSELPNATGAFKLPKDVVEDKIIVTVHKYSPKVGKQLDRSMQRVVNFRNAINAPIIIGEFGTKASEYDDDFRVNHAGGYVEIAAKYGIKTIWWDNGYLNDYGIIDRNNFSNSKINIIKSLTR